MEDLYAELGVSQTATVDEIKKAYRALARQYHPDHNAGDAAAEERFKRVSHAHDVLSDPDKRRQYDAERAFGGRGAGNGARPSGGGFAGDAAEGFGDFADIFSSIFRGGQAGARRGDGTAEPAPRRGGDVEVEVNLSFDQAMRGVHVPVFVETPVACADCNGSGAKPGTSPRLCPECKGRGVRGRDGGAFAFSEPCPRCHGNGTVIDDPCPTCGGSGSTSTRSQIRVKIPAGVKDGTRIRVKGRGQAGTRGGPAGDLQVVTRVAPSGLYTRQGDNLSVTVPVTFAEAALGARVEVPTLDGRVKLRVPAGSAEGRALRIPGKGAPKLKGEGRGDLIARLHVVVPDALTGEQREALERFAELDDSDPRKALFT
ncbi:MAG: molecular chaperone DnaJ [Thermoleophilia bacterium]